MPIPALDSPGNLSILSNRTPKPSGFGRCPASRHGRWALRRSGRDGLPAARKRASNREPVESSTNGQNLADTTPGPRLNLTWRSNDGHSTHDLRVLSTGGPIWLPIPTNRSGRRVSAARTGFRRGAGVGSVGMNASTGVDIRCRMVLDFATIKNSSGWSATSSWALTQRLAWNRPMAQTPEHVLRGALHAPSSFCVLCGISPALSVRAGCLNPPRVARRWPAEHL